MSRIVRTLRTVPARVALLVAIFGLAVSAFTYSTRVLVTGYDLERVDLVPGTYRIATERSRRGVPRYDRLSVLPVAGEAVPHLTYYKHEPTFTTIAEIDTTEPITVWYQRREPWVAIVPFGTIHAVAIDGEYIVDLAGTQLHRRRVGMRAWIAGMILLLLVVPAYAYRVARIARERRQAG